MKSLVIEALEVFVVATPPPGKGGRYFTFVKLTTADGLVGYGEPYGIPYGPAATRAVIKDVFQRHLRGHSAHDIEAFWRRAYSAGFSQRPDPSLMGAVSGLETALWDIMGKACGKPVYQLLGGCVEPDLRAYTYLYPAAADPQARAYADAQVAAERARFYADLGFTALKFDPAGPYTTYDPRQPSIQDLRFIETFVGTVRDAVGDRADLLFGTHGQFTPSGARQVAQVLEPFAPRWFEEPTPPENPEAMAEVARATTIPIATGERLTTPYEFAAVLRAGAASILQPALGRAGGILAAKKIAALAEAHQAVLAPHLYAGPIEALANIHLGLSIPNFLMAEMIETMGGFHADLLTDPIQIEQGRILPPTKPGLGAGLNEDLARDNPYAGTKLHLEMLDQRIWTGVSLPGTNADIKMGGSQ